MLNGLSTVNKISPQKAASWKRIILKKLSKDRVPYDVLDVAAEEINNVLRETTEADMKKVEDWWSTQPKTEEILMKFGISIEAAEPKEEEPLQLIDEEGEYGTESVEDQPVEAESTEKSEEDVEQIMHAGEPGASFKGPEKAVEKETPVPTTKPKTDTRPKPDEKLRVLNAKYNSLIKDKKDTSLVADYFVRIMLYVYQNPSNANQELLISIFKTPELLIIQSAFYEYISKKIAHETASVYSYMYTIYDSLVRSMKKRSRLNIDPKAATRALKGNHEITRFVIERTSRF